MWTIKRGTFGGSAIKEIGRLHTVVQKMQIHVQEVEGDAFEIEQEHDRIREMLQTLTITLNTYLSKSNKSQLASVSIRKRFRSRDSSYNGAAAKLHA